MGNNNVCKVVGIGKVSLKLMDGSNKILHNVRHVPSLKRNLISHGMLDAIGCEYSRHGGTLEVRKDSKVVLTAERSNGLFVRRGTEATGSINIVEDGKLTKADLWHKRLAHISRKGLQELAKQGILPNNLCEDLNFCEFCVYGKAKRQSFQIPEHVTKGIVDYIHSDLWGPTKFPH